MRDHVQHKYSCVDMLISKETYLLTLLTSLEQIVTSVPLCIIITRNMKF